MGCGDLILGGDTFTSDLSTVFSDPDGDPLTFSASSNDDGVATATVSESTLTVEAVALGSATITVTAADANGGVILSVDMEMLGSNSIQRLQFGVSDVRRLEVWFPSSGAVTDIVFCPPDDFCVEPALADPAFSTSTGNHAFHGTV